MAGRGGPDTVPWFVRRRRASPARHVGRLRASYPREGCLPHGVVDGSPTRPQVPLHVALYEKDRRVARTTHGSSRFRSCRRLRGHERNRSEEHTSELQSPYDLVCRLLLEKKKNIKNTN